MKKWGFGLLVSAGLALALVSMPGPTLAAAPSWEEDALTGRLLQIKQTRVIRLGHRANAVPFSYIGADGIPVGYTLDLCRAIVETIAADLGGLELRIDYVPVTPLNRIQQVVSGAVDLECGATTNTAERRRQVAFSPVIFVTGTRIAVPRGSMIRDLNDLRGRPAVVVSGTTNEAAMREYDRLNALAIRFVTADDYRAALTLLTTGRVDALAADDILLRGLLAETRQSTAFRLVGDMLSFEPYGIMYARGDSALADAVERTLRGLAESREIVWLYDRWFVRQLPSGERIGLPMSTQLRRSFELLGLPPE
jgi:glutamate/aspartate transport system substrate-binding protein